MTTALCAQHLSSLDENDFEEWLRVYMQEVYGLPVPPQRNGRSGQAQAGVDLMFRNAQGEWIGVQAKAYRRKRLTATLLNAEITAAHEFEPSLTHYVVCTLNERAGSA
jgi:predicted helicase